MLWWYLEPEQLSASARRAISEGEPATYVSAVSAFEIALKHRIGKLPQSEGLIEAFAVRAAGEGFRLLELTVEHALLGGRLDWPHKDPFDRLLVAQALADDLTLVSNEALFDATGVRRLW